MGYLNEFEKQIANKDFAKCLELWEEYCTSDKADIEEFLALIEMIRKSDLAAPFGKYMEMAIPLWQTIEDQKSNYTILKALMNLQTTNSPVLAEAAFQVLKAAHGDDPNFNERIRIIGLRTRENFEGALANYDLLAHMKVGNFVYHMGGWGCGEIMDCSFVREQLGIEFEHMSAIKHFTFKNAFKTLIPLPSEHFLVKRFGNPDAFEQEAKNDPIGVIKQLLRDLGPKTAAEIKDEMSELVIPESDWTKWWQNVRAKLKKDPFVQTPKGTSDPFVLRKTEITNEEMLNEEIHGKGDPDAIINSAYSLMRDLKKNQEVYNTVKTKLLELLEKPSLTPLQKLKIGIILEQSFNHKVEGQSIADIVKKLDNIEEVIEEIDIIALKKRLLVLVRENRSDWIKIFLSLMGRITLTPIRDYIFSELLESEASDALVQKLEHLQQNPLENPETVLWYFHKLLANKRKEAIPFGDKEGECLWFDAVLVLLSKIEHDPNQKDLTKKIVQTISANHFLAIRYMFEEASFEWVKETLLLLSKCMVFDESVQKIFRSLAQVVHSEIEGTSLLKNNFDLHVFWATQEAYNKARERAQRIGTVEIIQNAEEVKRARELGDLRENAEYKAACERRRRLQHDLKVLSDQINRARVITPADISPEAIGIGGVVKLKDSKGQMHEYTILGTWDADVDANILSLQSRFVQSMLGKKVGERFTFRDEEYTVSELRSFLEK